MALILDTGPLYAALDLDRSDADYAACRALIEASSEELVIPAPVLNHHPHKVIGRRAHPGSRFNDLYSLAKLIPII